MGSAPCEAEWNAAIAADFTGSKNSLIAFRLDEAPLKPLAKQVVYVSLMGFDEETRARKIREAVRGTPQPVKNVASVVDYKWRKGTMHSLPGEVSKPHVPAHRSDQDHANRLDACRKLAQRFHSDSKNNKFQHCSRAYEDIVERYLEDLPKDTRSGNFYVCDAQARELRNKFVADLTARDIGSAEAARLNGLVESHMALRAYYPQMEAYYDDVRNGRISEPLPLDAFSSVSDSIAEFKGEIFDDDVQVDLGKLDPAPNQNEADMPPVSSVGEPLGPEPGMPLPPPDPIGTVDPKAAVDRAKAGAVNRLWEVFISGEKLAKNGKAWSDAYDKLAPKVADIIEWLSKFGGGN